MPTNSTVDPTPATTEGNALDSSTVSEPLPPQDTDAYAGWVELVERIRSEQTDGMAELYRLFSKGIRFYLCRQLGPQDLDDKIHDTFVVVVQAIRRGELREPQRLMGFVRTVVRRQVAAHIDKVVHSRREQQDLEASVRVADPRGNPEEAAIFRQKEDLVHRVLSQLTDRDREILTRFYLHEQSQEQICTEMLLTETQFRLLKSRAKARFGELGKKKRGICTLQSTGLAVNLMRDRPGCAALQSHHAALGVGAVLGSGIEGGRTAGGWDAAEGNRPADGMFARRGEPSAVEHAPQGWVDRNSGTDRVGQGERAGRGARAGNDTARGESSAEARAQADQDGARQDSELRDVVYSPGMKPERRFESIENRLDATETHLKELKLREQTPVAPQPPPVPKEGWFKANIFWLSPLLSIVLGSGAGLAIVTSMLDGRIDQRVGARLSSVERSVENIKGRFDGISDLLGLVVRREFGRLIELPQPVFNEQLDEVQAVLTVAKKENIAVEADVPRLREKLRASPMDLPAYWGAAVALSNFRSAPRPSPDLPNCVKGSGQDPLFKGDFTHGSKEVKNVTPAVYFNCQITLDDPVAIDLFSQALKLYGLVFRNCHVVWNGGPIPTLKPEHPGSTIKLINCTYDLRKPATTPDRGMQQIVNSLVQAADQSTVIVSL